MFGVEGVVEMLGQKQGLDRAAPLPRGSLMEEHTRKSFLRRWEWLLLQVERSVVLLPMDWAGHGLD